MFHDGSIRVFSEQFSRDIERILYLSFEQDVCTCFFLSDTCFFTSFFDIFIFFADLFILFDDILTLFEMEGLINP